MVGQQIRSFVAGYVTRCLDYGSTNLAGISSRFLDLSIECCCAAGLGWTIVRSYLAIATRLTLAISSSTYQVPFARSRLPLSKQHST